jgi:hypothetical protein
MSTKSWSHVSPVTGVGPCGAQTPEACKFAGTKHFSSAAAARILAGRPANYDEHEAMRKHQQIMAEKNGTPLPLPEPAAKPKPKPKPVPRAAPAPVQQNRFPSQHRNSAQGRAPQRSETLYHMELGFPTGFRKPGGRVPLEYSRHALEATLDDRYGEIPVMKGINLDSLELFEMGVENGKVSKLAYRGHLDDKRDMCIVVIPKGPGQKWFVKTVWINLRSDQHKTLDESKYARPMASAAA